MRGLDRRSRLLAVAAIAVPVAWLYFQDRLV